MKQGSSLQSEWAGCGEALGSSPDLTPQSCSKPVTSSFPLCHGLGGVAWHGPAVPVAG